MVQRGEGEGEGVRFVRLQQNLCAQDTHEFSQWSIRVCISYIHFPIYFYLLLLTYLSIYSFFKQDWESEQGRMPNIKSHVIRRVTREGFIMHYWWECNTPNVKHNMLGMGDSLCNTAWEASHEYYMYSLEFTLGKSPCLSEFRMYYNWIKGQTNK